MKNWLKWFTLAPLLLLLAAVLVVQGLRLVAIGDAERDALALVEAAPAPVRGSNGFPALLLASYDVPADRVDAVMADEVGHFERWYEVSGEDLLRRQASGDGAAPPASNQHLPEARWPLRAALENDTYPCTLSDTDCLGKVGAAPEAARALLQREAASLAATERALAADHFRSPYPTAPEAPLPAYQLLRLPLAQSALDAVEGRVPESLARSCLMLAASRRFGTQATDLIGRMVFSASAEGAANLLMQTRRAHPQVALPSGCTEALAPVRNDDYLICEATRGEFRWSQSLSRRMDRATARSWRPADVGGRLLLMDAGLMDAWVAPRYAEPCHDAYRESVLAGVVPESRPRRVGPGDPHCYAAYISCILAQIAGVDYGKYQVRQLDHAAKLRLALASMAVAAGSSTREQAMAQAASPGYTLEPDPVAGTVSIALRADPGRGQNKRYTVPL